MITSPPVIHPDQIQRSQETARPHLQRANPASISTSIAGVDENICLAQLLRLLEFPQFDGWASELGQTDRGRGQLIALRDLWISLGRPHTGFWLHTYVFCTRISDSRA
jgi:hypothetical protein